MIFFGQRSLEKAVREYVEYYHAERNHPGYSQFIAHPLTDSLQEIG